MPDQQTTDVKPSEPRCFNVQFKDVTAESLRIRDVPDTEWVAVHVGDVLYVSFPSRAEARRFFAAGVELVDALPAEAEDR